MTSITGWSPNYNEAIVREALLAYGIDPDFLDRIDLNEELGGPIRSYADVGPIRSYAAQLVRINSVDALLAAYGAWRRSPRCMCYREELLFNMRYRRIETEKRFAEWLGPVLPAGTYELVNAPPGMEQSHVVVAGKRCIIELNLPNCRNKIVVPENVGPTPPDFPSGNQWIPNLQWPPLPAEGNSFAADVSVIYVHGNDATPVEFCLSGHPSGNFNVIPLRQNSLTLETVPVMYSTCKWLRVHPTNDDSSSYACFKVGNSMFGGCKGKDNNFVMYLRAQHLK